jgi:hypothetical protein
MATIDAPESSGDADDAENEEVVEPGKMRVSEIKSELELRGVDYSDCFDKESLATKLEEARSTGKATPDLIDKFNKAKLEETFREEKLAINDEDLQSMTANDGTLPGGMSPEAFKNAINNPELMAMAQNPKVQDAMKVVMTGGPEELENAMRKDPELREFLGKLTQVMGGIESSLESKGDISVLESKEDVSPPESVFD